jgi:lipoprotein-anchoring transpeptidase ErfK/SrfK
MSMRGSWCRTAASASLGLLFSAFVLATPSSANVDVSIDISTQTMTVSVDGWHYATWKVSTARDGYWTPRGSFRVWGVKRTYYSHKYDNAPMPYSVFFKGGYAIHGTGYIRALGRPASHGCIRLHPSNAARLYGLVQEYGLRRTRIRITN